MLDELHNRLQSLIDVREGIGREIANHKVKVGENTHRREDRLRQLEAEYSDVQRRILDLDQQIRCFRVGHIAPR